jgi:arsenite/tail-anchored protein-transporting ATPase
MSLDSLVSLAMHGDLKFVFVGGKGGVGKTTSSSAIATLLANCNKRRVLLISTDPAHSLSDAWRQSFHNIPTPVIPSSATVSTNGIQQQQQQQQQQQERDIAAAVAADMGTLDIMEVNPQQTLQSELDEWANVSQQVFPSISQDHSASSSLATSSTNSSSTEWHFKMNQFQEWLSGVPGIDEATALSSAIQHIESGKYDIIVFDTAPTGHTVKLLALPEILEQGIDQLQSWQTTFWTYWESFKAGMVGSNTMSMSKLKSHVKEKLTRYKHDMRKVSKMLQDQQRTRFIVVCIAEYLSIAETKRLLQELTKNHVVASHIIVNQLVVQDALSQEQLSQLQALAEVGDFSLPQELLHKTIQACRLTTARKQIQERYLKDLKSYTETQSILNGICEVPLLAEEITGLDAIQRFAQLLVTRDIFVSLWKHTTASKKISDNVKLYDDGGDDDDNLITAKNNADTSHSLSFTIGDIVRVTGLFKSPHLNGLEGTIVTPINQETGRYGVTVPYQDAIKSLALLPQNIVLLVEQKCHKRQRIDTNGDTNDATTTTSSDGENTGRLFDQTKAILLDDPEIRDMINSNPRFKNAVEDCLANPLNVMKYLGNPDMSPLISRVMSKLGGRS